ncbi:hypothetical protein F5884DRAFT_243513 [Xylogone sp. PMI_703]|nr:hypothetical protein F5884DRAFT_243513 [Xylogone sp. PMI_703]
MISSKRIACTACRQNKSRCEKSDGPCRRCTKFGLDCKEDPRFHRSNKNRKIDELEKRVQEFIHAIGQTNDASQAAALSIFGDLGNAVSLEESSIVSQTTETEGIQSLHTQEPTTYNLSPEYLDPTQSINPNGTIDPTYGLTSVDSNTIIGPDQLFSNNLQSSQSAQCSTYIFPQQHLDPTHPPVRRTGSTGSSFRLDSVDLSSNQADSLFNIYFTCYHAFLPFLIQKPPADVFAVSPLLFWAVITVSSRRYEQDIILSRALSGPVTQLAWETISSRPRDLSTIQALLLLCTWPFPMSSVFNQNTAIWSDISLRLAVQQGLHRPENPGDFNRIKCIPSPSLQPERIKTWAACNIVIQNSSCIHGSLPISLDLTFTIPNEHRYIHHLLKPLHNLLSMQRFCSKVDRALFGSTTGIFGPDPKSVDQIIQPLEDEIERLAQTLDNVTGITKLYHLSTELYLHIQCFFDSDTTSEHRKQRILKTYSVAEVLISAMSDADSDYSFFRYIPAYLFWMLFTACCVIWKVLGSSYREEVDFDHGKAISNEGITALRKCSIENNDVAARYSEIVAQLWQGINVLSPPQIRHEPPSLACTTRFGASIAYDSLFYWRDHVGGQRKIGLHSSTTVPINTESLNIEDNQPSPGVLSDDLGVGPFNGDWDPLNSPFALL